MANDRSKQLMTVYTGLNRLLNEKQKALPKNFNQTRFLQNCMTVLGDTPDIEKMDAMSVARTMLKGAFLGLDFFSKECYAIPYKNKEKGITELNFQTDYKGDIKLVKMYTLKPIKDIYAKVVRKGDFFEESVVEGRQVVNFKPQFFNDGPMMGAFAVCLFNDGSMLYESMSAKDIEHIRDRFSKAPNSPMWKETPGEGYKKTVLRRLTKMIPIEFRSIEQTEAYDEGGGVEFEDAQIVEPNPKPITMPRPKEVPEGDKHPEPPRETTENGQETGHSEPEPPKEASEPTKPEKDDPGPSEDVPDQPEEPKNYDAPQFDLAQKKIDINAYARLKGIELTKINTGYMQIKDLEKWKKFEEEVFKIGREIT